MKIEVVYSTWGVGDEASGDAHVFKGGAQEVELTPALAPFIAGGAAAGVCRVLEATDEEQALLDGHVQSQEDGEAAYEAATAEGGGWREGQLEQFTLDSQARLDSDDAEITHGHRAWLLESQIAAFEELGDAQGAKKARAALNSIRDAEAQEIGSEDVADASSVLGGDGA